VRSDLAHGRALVDPHAELLDGAREPREQLRRVHPRSVRRESRRARAGDPHALGELRAVELTQVSLL
jgi:hypothetical protein